MIGYFKKLRNKYRDKKYKPNISKSEYRNIKKKFKKVKKRKNYY